jgi:hypothetical protein
MKLMALIATATLCFATTESRVSRATILAVEKSINDTINVRTGDPYDVLGEARGTYLEGYGALFTIEVDLINAGPITPQPFKPTVSKEEIATTRDRKMKKLAILRESMRTLMMNASGTLEGLAPNEHVAMEAILFFYSWENSRDFPHRIFMSAEKQKLLDARSGHAGQVDLAKVIEEQER